jgi:histone chaperone ASF1
VRDPQEDASGDLILCEILVGPVVTGVHSFLLCADAPRRQDLRFLLGVTALLVTCSYRDQEFCRIGYYVNNEHHDSGNNSNNANANNRGEELLLDNKEGGIPSFDEELERNLDLSQVVRTILADKPRVTRFPIQWQDCQTQTHTHHTESGSSSGSSSTPMKLVSHDATMELTTTTTTPNLVSPAHHVDMQL